MEEVILWLFHRIVDLVNAVLSWKLIGSFSLLHFVLGGVILITILNLVSFGTLSIGGTADYVGGIRRFKNRENARDRERYAEKKYTTYTHRESSNGKVSDSITYKKTRRERT